MDTILQFGRVMLGICFCLFMVMYACAIFLTRKKSELSPEKRAAVRQRLHVGGVLIVLIVAATALMDSLVVGSA
ncbi:MAG: hypothetical protein BGO50_01790 [Rhodanobacter sp. 67-28]|nr:MAG: hypothetical protein BGO50_01790 [Rhodanobacter sp. 67-28]